MVPEARHLLVHRGLFTNPQVSPADMGVVAAPRGRQACEFRARRSHVSAHAL